MARRTHRPAATHTYRLTPWRTTCVQCGEPLWVAYTSRRHVTPLQGVCQLILSVRMCYNPSCPL